MTDEAAAATAELVKLAVQSGDGNARTPAQRNALTAQWRELCGNMASLAGDIINNPDVNGVPPAHYLAARTEYPDWLTIGHEHGMRFDQYATPAGRGRVMPIHMAALARDRGRATADIIETLLQLDAESEQQVNATACATDLTALHIVTDHSDIAAMRVLLLHKANPNAELNDGGGRRTPLHIAASYGTEPAIHLLLRFGADVWKMVVPPDGSPPVGAFQLSWCNEQLSPDIRRRLNTMTVNKRQPPSSIQGS